MKPGPSGGGSGQGIIRVQSQSPYEELDPTLKKWFVQLKSVWSVSK